MSAQLEKLRKQREQLDARIKAAAARAKEQERKDRTRALILLGAALEQFVKRNPEARTALIGRLQLHIAEKDRVLVARFLAPSERPETHASE